MGDAMHYTTANLKAVEEQVKNSIEAVIAAYKELQAIATRTGMGGDSGQRLNAILESTSDDITVLQKKIENMGTGVEAKEAEDNASARRADDIWNS